MSCRLRSPKQAPERRQRSLPVAATTDAAPHRQASAKVRSTGHFAEDHHCFTCTPRNVVTLQGSCYGCGLPLQAAQPGVAGYVAADKAAPMVQHKHNKRILCERCQELSNGRMIPAVEDFSSRQMSGNQPIHVGQQSVHRGSLWFKHEDFAFAKFSIRCIHGQKKKDQGKFVWTDKT